MGGLEECVCVGVHTLMLRIVPGMKCKTCINVSSTNIILIPALFLQ